LPVVERETGQLGQGMIALSIAAELTACQALLSLWFGREESAPPYRSRVAGGDPRFVI